MIFKRILQTTAASVAATSAMTLFSYALSAICRENYREPELLSEVFGHERKGEQRPQKKQEGWLAHYVMGLVWAGVYTALPDNLPESAPRKDLMFGALSGKVSALAWRSMLGRHPELLAATKPSFFIQLVPAHIVYACVLDFFAHSSGKHD